MKFYISFGQGHAHRVDGITYDCDSLYMVEAPSELAARQEVFSVFGNKWSSIYPAAELPNLLHYFPRGVMNEAAR